MSDNDIRPAQKGCCRICCNSPFILHQLLGVIKWTIYVYAAGVAEATAETLLQVEPSALAKTRYFVAPETAVHVSFICLSPAVALTFVGAETTVADEHL